MGTTQLDASTEESAHADAQSRRRPVLDVRGLQVAYRRHEDHPAVESLDLRLHPGEIVAIVGESGSGKSSTVNAILGLTPHGTRVTADRFLVHGKDLRDADPREFRSLRGRHVGFVPQDPTVALNPTQTIGKQVAEALTTHAGIPRPELQEKVIAVLRRVGLTEAERIASSYPHELSGGMRQRVLIAIALAPEPSVIVADEPTSALDVTVQRVILDDLVRSVRERGTALLIITHDLGVAQDRADHLIIMKSGRVVESGSPHRVRTAPQTDYARRLLEAAPGFAAATALELAEAQPRRAARSEEAPVVLAVEGISKSFAVRGAGVRTERQVLHDVSFSVRRGTTLALVGESGSGKTTIGRIVAGLTAPDGGAVSFQGRDALGRGARARRAIHRDLQYVYQNPYSSLDPRFTIARILEEPLRNYRIGSAASRRAKVASLLDRVALPSRYLKERPVHLSGGQRQRVAIARALALDPALLVLDEPVSALDVSVQHQILELLRELQDQLELSYVFVSHDLGVVAQVADQVAVLAEGRIVESGTVRQVFQSPEHPITQALIDAIPGLGRDLIRQR